MQWLINGRTFRLEPENPETKKRMEKAFSVMEQEEKQILSDYCAMFRKLFAGIFGEKKARQIFQSLPENPRIITKFFFLFCVLCRLPDSKTAKKRKNIKNTRGNANAECTL